MLKRHCECCSKELLPDSAQAVVCSFDCTYCTDCAERKLGYRCPNCAGELRPRPRRKWDSSTEEHEEPAVDVVPQAAKPDGEEIHESDAVLETLNGELHGSLLLPVGQPKAWALIISGAGNVDRNGNNAGQPYKHNCLRYLALNLAAQGIASLRYDKRGAAASAGACEHESTLTFETFVEDAKAWAVWLRRKASGPITLIGHSEGAQIATRVGVQIPVASVVNLCGAGRPLDVLLLEQLQRQLTPELYAKAESILAHLHERSLKEEYRQPKPKMPRWRGKGDELKVPDIPPELHPLFSTDKFPFYVSRMRERPDRELEALRCPVLLVSGDTDIQVGEEDYNKLCAAAPDAEKLRIAGMNHLLKQVGDVEMEQHRSYIDPAMPLDASLGEVVGTFVLKTSSCQK